MVEQLIPLATGGAGGLLGGNVLGSLFRKAGVNTASSSIVGIIAGALATQFFGPTIGNIIGAAVGSGALDPMAILGNLIAGAGGGGIGAVLLGLLRSVMGGRG